MAKRMKWLLALGVTAMFGAPVIAQNITLTCRCVEGGVSSAQVEWIKEYIIPEFESANPGVSVELVEFGGTDEALKQQYALDLSVGRGNDLMGFDGFWIPEFASGGLLQPLNDVAGDAVDSWDGWDQIATGIQDIMSYGGERYGIANGTDVRMIFYRTDLLAEAGVENPAEWQPNSWEELLDAAALLKEANPDSYPLQINAGTSMGEATTMQGYYMLILGTGEEPFMDDKWVVRSQGILDTLNFYKTVYIDNAYGSQRMQLVQDGRDQSFASFRDGDTALLVEGDWFYRSVTAPGSEFAVDDRDENMSWAAMPAREPGAGIRGQDFVSASGGTGWVLNPNSDNPDEVWALMAFMNSKEARDVYQTYQPGISARSDVPVPDNQFLTDTAAALLPYTVSRPNNDHYARVSEQLQLMTENVVSGAMTPEQAMEAYATMVTQIVGAENTVDLLD